MLMSLIGNMMAQNTEDLKLDSYDYDLPKKFIASRPACPRDHSRLLVYKKFSDQVIHDRFINLDNYLPPKSLLVLNETKVFPCRFVGTKKSGGKCEIFLLSPRPNEGLFRALIRTTSKKRIGDEFFLASDLVAKIEAIFDPYTFGISFDGYQQFEQFESKAMVPIPPYVREGVSDLQDRHDYQTLFAKNIGSVAAPTAGFHFTPEVFTKLQQAQIEKAYVTLHVGMGTFAPVKSESITEHKMHEEDYTIGALSFDKIMSHGERIAVGTTTLRVLESVQRYKNDNHNNILIPDHYYKTDIFLYPGQSVTSVKGLITNFHLPRSSLLMLVSSLIGRKKTLELYEEAKRESYRFYSYGDAMLILLEA